MQILVEQFWHFKILHSQEVFDHHRDSRKCQKNVFPKQNEVVRSCGHGLRYKLILYLWSAALLMCLMRLLLYVR